MSELDQLLEIIKNQNQTIQINTQSFQEVKESILFHSKSIAVINEKLEHQSTVFKNSYSSLKKDIRELKESPKDFKIYVADSNNGKERYVSDVVAELYGTTALLDKYDRNELEQVFQGMVNFHRLFYLLGKYKKWVFVAIVIIMVVTQGSSLVELFKIISNM
jgi:hypothetical protein